MLLSLIRKTVRDYRRPVLGWGLGLTALTLMQMAVYPSVRSQGASMRELIDSYPTAFKAMFGMEGVDFTSGPGYLSTETFSLLAPLMLIGLGVALGTGAIAGEEERGTLDLLMASPVSRGRVLAAKALGSLAALVAVAVVLYLTVLAAASGLGMSIGAGMLAQATAAVLLLAIACGAVAFLPTRRPASAARRSRPVPASRSSLISSTRSPRSPRWSDPGGWSRSSTRPRRPARCAATSASSARSPPRRSPRPAC